MKTRLPAILALAGVLGCGPALAQDQDVDPPATTAPQEAHAGHPGQADALPGTDVDGDGRLSLAEFTAGSQRTAEDFAAQDADGDGYVTAQELQAARHQHLTPGSAHEHDGKPRPAAEPQPDAPASPRK